MTPSGRPRFNVSTLEELAGAKVFARGQEYFRNGHVTIISIEKERVLADVAGTENYRTLLTGRGKSFGGECSCPAFEDWGFCKHMAAVALAVNAGEGGDVAEGGSGAVWRASASIWNRSVVLLYAQCCWNWRSGTAQPIASWNWLRRPPAPMTGRWKRDCTRP